MDGDRAGELPRVSSQNGSLGDGISLSSTKNMVSLIPYLLALWLVGCGIVRKASFPTMCLQGHSTERARETPSIVGNPPELEVCFRKQSELIIVMPPAAKKSRFNLRAAQKYKKGD